ncbi:MAG: TatD family hydrolase [Gammaproteobacteria bacterium]|nr:TatD family hydrolase [Gammaproteobacteria bacterium]
MLVDSHCHIPVIEGIDREEILANARENGITHMLCVCIDLETLGPVLELAQQYDHIYASVGVHPNTETDREPSAEELADIAERHPEIIAIGETGLDYFRSTGDLDWQRERFRTHIRAAKQARKPLIIHSREAREDTLKILGEEGADAVGGIMHCFVEDWPTAEKAMQLGFYISFSGIVTFKNAGDLKEVARKVPLDRLLVETDSPYLAPMPYRGKTNQPAYVKHVAEHIAELKGVDYDQVAAATSENFFRLFDV